MLRGFLQGDKITLLISRRCAAEKAGLSSFLCLRCCAPSRILVGHKSRGKMAVSRPSVAKRPLPKSNPVKLDTATVSNIRDHRHISHAMNASASSKISWSWSVIKNLRLMMSKIPLTSIKMWCKAFGSETYSCFSWEKHQPISPEPFSYIHTPRRALIRTTPPSGQEINELSPIC
jgi:hypothetical protein